MTMKDKPKGFTLIELLVVSRSDGLVATHPTSEVTLAPWNSNLMALSKPTRRARKSPRSGLSLMPAARRAWLTAKPEPSRINRQMSGFISASRW